MKSRARAMTLLLLLVLAWGALVASPFRAFAELTRDLSYRLGTLVGLDFPFRVLWAYFAALLVLVGLLLLSRSRVRHYVAPFCALAAFAYNLVLSFFGGHGYAIALSTSIGLALALVLLLPKNQTPVMWLGDAYIMAIPAMVLFDALVIPGLDRIGVEAPVVRSWIELPTTSLVQLLQKSYGLDVLVWGLILAAVAALPTVFLTDGRQKGQGRQKG
jgi:hypothetical protein